MSSYLRYVEHAVHCTVLISLPAELIYRVHALQVGCQGEIGNRQLEMSLCKLLAFVLAANGPYNLLNS